MKLYIFNCILVLTNALPLSNKDINLETLGKETSIHNPESTDSNADITDSGLKKRTIDWLTPNTLHDLESKLKASLAAYDTANQLYLESKNQLWEASIACVIPDSTYLKAKNDYDVAAAKVVVAKPTELIKAKAFADTVASNAVAKSIVADQMTKRFRAAIDARNEAENRLYKARLVCINAMNSLDLYYKGIFWVWMPHVGITHVTRLSD